MSFNINAQVILSQPKNLNNVTKNISSKLGKATKIDLKIGNIQQLNNINKQLNTLNKNFNALNSNLNSIKGNFNNLNSSLGKTSATQGTLSKQTNKANQSLKTQAGLLNNLAGRFKSVALQAVAFGAISRPVYDLQRALTGAVKDSVKFQREVVKISQVTGKSVGQLSDLTSQIDKLSVSLGISATELAETARIIAQTGKTAEETRVILNALGKSTLAPTFGNITDTTEGLIAALGQFNLQAKDSEAILGSLNNVSKNFAVEAEDLVSVIRRTGGVFSQAAGDSKNTVGALQELSAIFTAVRSNTRESADTIAAGLRTIFSRIQRRDTIEFLKGFGVELTDLNGKFIGIFPAFDQLSKKLDSLVKSGDAVQLSAIAEELGGIRQIGKLLPAIANFEDAREALGAAQRGAAEGLDKDVGKALDTVAVRLAKVQSAFQQVIRTVFESDAFQNFTKNILQSAEGFLTFANNIAQAIEPILPILSTLGAFKLGAGLSGLIKGGAVGAVASTVSGRAGAQAAQQNVQATNTTNTILNKMLAQVTALTNIVKSRGFGGFGGRRRADGGSIPKFADGGRVYGPSHAAGGVIAELEGGEYVIPKKYVNGNLVTPGQAIVRSSGRRAKQEDIAQSALAGGLKGGIAGTAGGTRLLGTLNKATENLSNNPDVFGGIFLRPPGQKENLTGFINPNELQKISPAAKFILGKGAPTFKTGTDPIAQKLRNFKTKFKEESDFKLKVRSLDTKISDNLEENIFDGVINAIREGSTALGQSLGLKDEQQPKNLITEPFLKKFNIDQVIGNLFEAILNDVGAPYKDDDSFQKGKGNANFDFPRGLTPELNKIFGTGLQKGQPPVDARATINQGLVAGLLGKVERFYIDELEKDLAIFKEADVSVIKQALGLRTFQAGDIRDGFKGTTTTRKFGAGFASGGEVPVRISNGEMVVTNPKEVAARRGELQRINKLSTGGFASGYIAKGPGTGTSDSIYTTLPAGAFVVNAASTKKFLGRAAGGSIPRFKDGGTNLVDLTAGRREAAADLRFAQSRGDSAGIVRAEQELKKFDVALRSAQKQTKKKAKADEKGAKAAEKGAKATEKGAKAAERGAKAADRKAKSDKKGGGFGNITQRLGDNLLGVTFAAQTLSSTLFEADSTMGQFTNQVLTAITTLSLVGSIVPPGGFGKIGSFFKGISGKGIAGATATAGTAAGTAAFLVAAPVIGGVIGNMVGKKLEESVAKGFEPLEKLGDVEGRRGRSAAQAANEGRAKGQARGAGVGGGIGLGAGAAIGFLFGGPLGAAIGAGIGTAAGAAIGAYFGGEARAKREAAEQKLFNANVKIVESSQKVASAFDDLTKNVNANNLAQFNQQLQNFETDIVSLTSGPALDANFELNKPTWMDELLTGLNPFANQNRVERAGSTVVSETQAAQRRLTNLDFLRGVNAQNITSQAFREGGATDEGSIQDFYGPQGLADSQRLLVDSLAKSLSGLELVDESTVKAINEALSFSTEKAFEKIDIASALGQESIDFSALTLDQFNDAIVNASDGGNQFATELLKLQSQGVVNNFIGGLISFQKQLEESGKISLGTQQLGAGKQPIELGAEAGKLFNATLAELLELQKENPELLANEQQVSETIGKLTQALGSEILSDKEIANVNVALRAFTSNLSEQSKKQLEAGFEAGKTAALLKEANKGIDDFVETIRQATENLAKAQQASVDAIENIGRSRESLTGGRLSTIKTTTGVGLGDAGAPLRDQALTALGNFASVGDEGVKNLKAFNNQTANFNESAKQTLARLKEEENTGKTFTAKEITNAIVDDFEKAGQRLPEQLANSLKSGLEGVSRQISGDEIVNLQGLQESIESGALKELGDEAFKEVTEATEKLISGFEDLNKRTTDVVNAWVDANKRLREANVKALEKRQQGAEAVRKIGGDTSAQTFEQATDNLTEKLSVILGGGKAGASAVQDPSALLARRQQLQADLQEARESQALGTGTPDGGVQEFQRLSTELQKTDEALNTLANETGRLAAIQAKSNDLLQKQQQAQQTVGDLVRRAAEDPAALADLNAQISNLGQFIDENGQLNREALENASPEDLLQAQQFLQDSTGRQVAGSAFGGAEGIDQLGNTLAERFAGDLAQFAEARGADPALVRAFQNLEQDLNPLDELKDLQSRANDIIESQAGILKEIAAQDFNTVMGEVTNALMVINQEREALIQSINDLNKALTERTLKVQVVNGSGEAGSVGQPALLPDIRGANLNSRVMSNLPQAQRDDFASKVTSTNKNFDKAFADSIQNLPAEVVKDPQKLGDIVSKALESGSSEVKVAAESTKKAADSVASATSDVKDASTTLKESLNGSIERIESISTSLANVAIPEDIDVGFSPLAVTLAGENQFAEVLGPIVAQKVEESVGNLLVNAFDKLNPGDLTIQNNTAGLS